MRHRLSLLVLLLMSLANLTADEARSDRGRATRSVVWSTHGMVAAAQPLAVQVGVDILKKGGTAVDAAIAVNACLGLMEPTANGMGGDLFAIVWDPKTGKLHGLNAAGRSPLGLTADQVVPDEKGLIPLYSPYAWSVPGCVGGWVALHEKFGKLPLSELLEPAARYAEEGFPVSPVIAGDWERSLTRFADKPGFKDVFMPGGRAPAEGEVFKNPALAKTLRAVGAGGRDAYYAGPISEAIVAYSQANGGFFSREDFAKNQPEWVEPISTTYRHHTIWELPPPGQGLAALEMLNILETFDLRSKGRASADYWHIMVEAKKLAFADRARYYADPEFAKVPVEKLLSKEYARERAKRIHMDKAATQDLPGDPAALGLSETTYLCTGDSDGMMVSLIQSNYTGFGSGYVIPELGFGIQNRGGLFSLSKGHPNVLEPGKRPFHTIIPAFVTKDGKPLMAFGLMGGDMQPQGHAQVIANIVDFGMNLQEAGDALRFHHTGSGEPTGTTMANGGELHFEPGMPREVLADLQRRGHRITPEHVAAFGGYQAIWRNPETGTYAGATEYRKDGCAIGY